jgi:hypothetical protein
MFDRVRHIRKELEEELRKSDTDVLDPDYAAELLAEFTAITNLGEAGKALVSRRVANTGAWQKEGDRTAAHFIAKRTGDTVSSTITAIETAERLRDLSATEEAFRAGELSPVKAAAIAEAASVAPKAEKTLL